MMRNPIYERERKKAARSRRFSLIFLLFNSLLAAVALFSMAVTLHRAGENGELRYAVFLRIFRWLAWIEFAMVIAMVPARTAACITGEKEKKTFDLLVSTRMRPAEIIAGDMLTAVSSVLLLLLSGGPVFAAVLLYGGVRLSELLLLSALCALTALFVGSVGMLFSVLSESTAASMGMTYGAVALLLFGPYGVSFLAGGLSFASAEVSYLFPLSPLAVFHAALSAVTGEKAFPEEALLQAALGETKLLVTGVALQLLLSALLLFAAGRRLSPSAAGKRIFRPRDFPGDKGLIE